jgi:hypothetical protein
VVEYSFAGDDG